MQLVLDETNHVLLSAVVVWETAVKRSLGKLDVSGSFIDVLVAAGARPLPITIEHAVVVRDLELHHRDPFDRMLVAQALVEGAAIVSADPALSAYDVRVEW